MPVWPSERCNAMKETDIRKYAELMKKADELMYEEKNRWHAKYMKK